MGKTADVTENLRKVSVESRNVSVPVLQLEYEEHTYQKIGAGREPTL